jgi:hypothetical protein
MGLIEGKKGSDKGLSGIASLFRRDDADDKVLLEAKGKKEVDKPLSTKWVEVHNDNRKAKRARKRRALEWRKRVASVRRQSPALQVIACQAHGEGAATKVLGGKSEETKREERAARTRAELRAFLREEERLTQEGRLDKRPAWMDKIIGDMSDSLRKMEKK